MSSIGTWLLSTNEVSPRAQGKEELAYLKSHYPHMWGHQARNPFLASLIFELWRFTAMQSVAYGRVRLLKQSLLQIAHDAELLAEQLGIMRLVVHFSDVLHWPTSQMDRTLETFLILCT